MKKLYAIALCISTCHATSSSSSSAEKVRILRLANDGHDFIFKEQFSTALPDKALIITTTKGNTFYIDVAHLSILSTKEVDPKIQQLRDLATQLKITSIQLPDPSVVTKGIQTETLTLGSLPTEVQDKILTPLLTGYTIFSCSLGLPIFAPTLNKRIFRQRSPAHYTGNHIWCNRNLYTFDGTKIKLTGPSTPENQYLDTTFRSSRAFISAMVRDEDRSILFDSSGQEITKIPTPQYLDFDDSHLIACYTDGKIDLYNQQCEHIKTVTRAQKIQPFLEIVASQFPRIHILANNHYLVDTQGNMIKLTTSIGEEIEEVRFFNQGIMARINGKIYIFDRQGKNKTVLLNQAGRVIESASIYNNISVGDDRYIAYNNPDGDKAMLYNNNGTRVPVPHEVIPERTYRLVPETGIAMLETSPKSITVGKSRIVFIAQNGKVHIYDKNLRYIHPLQEYSVSINAIAIGQNSIGSSQNVQSSSGIAKVFAINDLNGTFKSFFKKTINAKLLNIKNNNGVYCLQYANGQKILCDENGNEIVFSTHDYTTDNIFSDIFQKGNKIVLEDKEGSLTFWTLNYIPPQTQFGLLTLAKVCFMRAILAGLIQQGFTIRTRGIPIETFYTIFNSIPTPVQNALVNRPYGLAPFFVTAARSMEKAQITGAPPSTSTTPKEPKHPAQVLPATPPLNPKI